MSAIFSDPTYNKSVHERIDNLSEKDTQKRQVLAMRYIRSNNPLQEKWFSSWRRVMWSMSFFMLMSIICLINILSTIDLRVTPVTLKPLANLITYAMYPLSIGFSAYALGVWAISQNTSFYASCKTSKGAAKKTLNSIDFHYHGLISLPVGIVITSAYLLCVFVITGAILISSEKAFPLYEAAVFSLNIVILFWGGYASHKKIKSLSPDILNMRSVYLKTLFEGNLSKL